jgi:hypothetical protein
MVNNFFSQILKKNIQLMKDYFDNFSEKNPELLRTILLTLIYFYGFLDLNIIVISNIFSLGFFLDLSNPFIKLLFKLISLPFFKIWASPEKTYFFSYLVLELIVTRSVLKISKFIKFNILLIFALIMLQNLTIAFFDLCFSSQQAILLILGLSNAILEIKNYAAVFYFIIFIVYSGILCFFYFNALKGKIVVLKNLEWITDSVAFWLRIKTPTMRDRFN